MSGKPYRKPLQVKFDDGERDRVERAAGVRGLATSTWIRFEILKLADEVIRDATPPGKPTGKKRK